MFISRLEQCANHSFVGLIPALKSYLPQGLVCSYRRDDRRIGNFDPSDAEVKPLAFAFGGRRPI